MLINVSSFARSSAAISGTPFPRSAFTAKALYGGIFYITETGKLRQDLVFLFLFIALSSEVMEKMLTK